MTDPAYPFFVYGTLKRGESNYGPYLAGRTVAEQEATLQGAVLFTEGVYPYLVRATDTSDLVAPQAQVSGMLMTVRPDVYALALAALDDLEDYRPGDPQNWYERVRATVQTPGGAVLAWTYVAGPRVLAAVREGSFRTVGSVWRRADWPLPGDPADY